MRHGYCSRIAYAPGLVSYFRYVGAGGQGDAGGGVYFDVLFVERYLFFSRRCLFCREGYSGLIFCVFLTVLEDYVVVLSCAALFFCLQSLQVWQSFASFRVFCFSFHVKYEEAEVYCVAAFRSFCYCYVFRAVRIFFCHVKQVFGRCDGTARSVCRLDQDEGVYFVK